MLVRAAKRGMVSLSWAIAVVAVFTAAAGTTPGRDIGGSFVALFDPDPGDFTAGSVAACRFFVWNASADFEWISDIALTFPEGFTIDESSMWFQQLEPGRPNWLATVVGETAYWSDADGLYGELFGGEGVYLGLSVIPPPGFSGGSIVWELWGDGWGGEPHYISGSHEVFAPTPVERSTWALIKALFREQSPADVGRALDLRPN